VHRRPHQGAWGVGGPGDSKAPTQDERRGEERGVGAAEGPARVHVTRQGHRRHGQGKRAATQAPPALDNHSASGRFLPGDVLCVCWYVCWLGEYVRLPSSLVCVWMGVCIYI
jgi:hypothetical protein